MMYIGGRTMKNGLMVIAITVIASWMMILTDCPVSGSPNAEYNLRDTGPAGGLIFYENPDYATDGWRYLEAAPAATDTTAAWSNVTTIEIGTTGAAVGTGQSNTTAIISQPGHTGSAAQVCDDLSIVNDGTTYGDWFLPSKDELALMYSDLKSYDVGGFPDAHYWSSSETNNIAAEFQNFLGGTQASNPKGTVTLHVRAVRAF